MGPLMVPEPTFCYPHRGIPSPRRVIVCRGAGALRFEVYKGGLETHSGTPICGIPKDRTYSLCVLPFSPVKEPRTASYYITLNLPTLTPPRPKLDIGSGLQLAYKTPTTYKAGLTVQVHLVG